MSDLIKYESNGVEVTLSSDIIGKFLVRGNGKITGAEAKMFLMLCKSQNLNPFINEAYLVKFGNAPAQMIVGKEKFIKRVSNSPDCKCWKAGIILLDNEKGIVYREGAFKLPAETLVGGWAELELMNDRKMRSEVSLNEYDKGKSTWKDMPATMIRKVALCQVIRETFPNEFGACYGAEEITGDAEQTIIDIKPTDKSVPTLPIKEGE
jgi:phage recombination protein Bet